MQFAVWSWNVKSYSSFRDSHERWVGQESLQQAMVLDLVAESLQQASGTELGRGIMALSKSKALVLTGRG